MRAMTEDLMMIVPPRIKILHQHRVRRDVVVDVAIDEGVRCLGMAAGRFCDLFKHGTDKSFRHLHE